jgi:hypothetical protein
MKYLKTFEELSPEIYKRAAAGFRKRDEKDRSQRKKLGMSDEYEEDFLLDKDGNLVGLSYHDKSGNEDYFFSCFAGFIKDGSFINMKGEESEDYYRYIFKDGKMIHQSADVVIKYNEVDEEVYEFGKPSSSDLYMIEWRKNLQEQSAKDKTLAVSENN